jgi:cold shock CspA family protein
MRAPQTGRVKTIRPGVAGWIEPDQGGADVWFHTKQAEGMEPERGDRVLYTEGRDSRGRRRADHVRVLG